MSEQLDEEQKKIIRMIEKEAIKQGIDPDFALAIAQAESNFRHIPAKDENSTAFGPFQVNKPTASTLKYDYSELVKHPELAVEAGVKNLVKHANDPRLEGDPTRIVHAHHFGADSPFALTGDRRLLNKDQANYIASIGEALPTGDYPHTVLQQSNTGNEAPNENIYGGQSVADYGNVEPETSVPTAAGVGAAAGAGAGLLYATKKPLIGVARHFGVLPSEATNIIDQKMDSSSLQRYLNSQVRDANNPYAKVSLDKLEKATGTKIQSYSDIQKALSALQATETIPAERIAETKIIGGRERKIPIYKQKSRIEGKPQTMLSELQQPLTMAEKSATNVAKTPVIGPAINAVGRILASAPVRTGATMGNVAANAQDLSESMNQGNTSNAMLAGAGLASDVGSMIPKVAPAASTFAAMLDAYKRARDQDYIGSFTSGLGAAAPYVLPFALGPEVGIPAGIATAMGSPLANIAKDWLQSRSKE